MPRKALRQKKIYKVYQLKISLKETRPPIWRRIQVHGSSTLFELHRILQLAMGWNDRHPHQFSIGESLYGSLKIGDLSEKMRDETKVQLGSVAPPAGSKFLYTYDFENCWQHTLLVEKILEPDPQQTYPFCMEGKRQGPPEDCGGVAGYAQMLKAYANSRHPEHKKSRESLGENFDPAAFSVKALNDALESMLRVEPHKEPALEAPFLSAPGPRADPFLMEVQTRLTSMSVDELQMVALTFAQALPKKERSQFLDFLEAVPALNLMFGGESSLPVEVQEQLQEEAAFEIHEQNQAMVDELREQARQNGQQNPQMYWDVISLLRHTDRDSEAFSFLQESLHAVKGPPPARAQLLDLYAMQAEKQGKTELAFQAKHEAWRTAPTLLRAVSLFSDLSAAQVQNLASSELEAVEQSLFSLRAPLLVFLQALSGQIQPLAISLRHSAGLGWGDPKHPAQMAAPLLLLHLSAQAEPPPGSSMEHICLMVGDGRWIPFLDERVERLHGPPNPWPKEDDYFDLHGQPDERHCNRESPLKACLKLLKPQLQRLLLAQEQEQVLEALRSAALLRAQEILESKQRSIYDQAACILVAVAEACQLGGMPAGSQEFLQQAYLRFGKYKAFCKELDTLLRRSSVLKQT